MNFQTNHRPTFPPSRRRKATPNPHRLSLRRPDCTLLGLKRRDPKLFHANIGRNQGSLALCITKDGLAAIGVEASASAPPPKAPPETQNANQVGPKQPRRAQSARRKKSKDEKLQRSSKSSLGGRVIEMLQRPQGAPIAAIMKATRWQHSEHGLEQDFNSLDAQREAAGAYIKSQAHEGWRLVKTHYDDGGLSGGTLERAALQSLLEDIRARKIDVVVAYKVDRLTRSLADSVRVAWRLVRPPAGVPFSISNTPKEKRPHTKRGAKS